MDSEFAKRAEETCNGRYDGYTCQDGISIKVPHRSETVPESTIRYASGKQGARTVASGTEFSRDMAGLLGGLGVRTIVLPKTIRRVSQGAFHKAKLLRYVALNEGLEKLGSGEQDEEALRGVFEESGLRHVTFSSTVRYIEKKTFRGCKNLKDVDLPEQLECIGSECFQESGLESVRLPRAMKTVEENTFRACADLRSVEFPRGLEEIR